MSVIKFTNTMGVPEEYGPKPADKFIPSWYKDLESYLSGQKKPDGNGKTSPTAKRCMPIFDALVSGYILTTYVDVWVKQVQQTPEEVISKASTTIPEYDTQPFYEWPSFEPLGFHPIEQAPQHPVQGSHKISYPKWNNPWAITTPVGYSVLFVQPLHRESIFTILPGVVDTDSYHAPVNFPFVLNQANTFEGLIPAGTPMAQVIPFKRDDWEMTFGSSEEIATQMSVTTKLRTKFFDSYKTQFRQIKEYK